MEQKSPVEATQGRVLVVDDDLELRRGIGRILRARGYEVIEVGDAPSAIEKAAREHFDVVVSDVSMPEMSGVELLRALHEKDPDLSVLLVSGVPDLETALKAVQYGARDFLMKPVDPSKLEDSVIRAVESSRDKREARLALDQYRSGERLRTPSSVSSYRESWTGAVLGGKYRIGALIGQGGMGSVYEAVREDLHMPVAVKIVHGSLDFDPELVARFRREAETIAALDHPNIVRIFDFEAPADGPAFLVMERLHGMSLGRLIDIEGSLPARRVVGVIAQVLGALGAAHRHNIVHRDLKPDNIFLTSAHGIGDMVRVLDFGIAKMLDVASDQKLTRTGAVLGTPAYMAPEQARGTSIDRRSDVYAVGCVMYEALAGKPPFEADNYNALLFAIQETEPAALEELRPQLETGLIEVVRRAMAKVPAERFQSVDEMFEALSPWSMPASAIPPTRPSTFASEPTVLDAEDPRLRTTRREGGAKPRGKRKGEG